MNIHSTLKSGHFSDQNSINSYLYIAKRSIINPELIFSKYHPLLISVASKFVKTKEEAEDLTQDAFMNWLSTDWQKIRNHKAYLVKSVKNACIDYLARLKRENSTRMEYLSEAASEYQYNFSLLVKDLEQDMKAKFAEMMRKLNHKEQAVFVLRDMFKFSYEEVSEVIETKAENSRKIFQRAKAKMKSDKLQFDLDKSEYNKTYPAFLKATIGGHISDYVSKLKKNF
ncbi:MAG: sigma-70 family RNA polymerase sigma factor [Chitinophagales bacterium]|nr:sigma-70 family RNA polymerase sigma factor [Chitinophagales bacterium]